MESQEIKVTSRPHRFGQLLLCPRRGRGSSECHFVLAFLGMLTSGHVVMSRLPRIGSVESQRTFSEENQRSMIFDTLGVMTLKIYLDQCH